AAAAAGRIRAPRDDGGLQTQPALLRDVPSAGGEVEQLLAGHVLPVEAVGGNVEPEGEEGLSFHVRQGQAAGTAAGRRRRGGGAGEPDVVDLDGSGAEEKHLERKMKARVGRLPFLRRWEDFPARSGEAHPALLPAGRPVAARESSPREHPVKG